MAAHPEQHMKSVTKWVGGKAKIVDDILPHFPPWVNSYFEPFVGGGSVLLRVLRATNEGVMHIAGRVVASDSNADIIGVYRCLQRDPVGLSHAFQALIKEYNDLPQHAARQDRRTTTKPNRGGDTETFYMWLRQTFNQNRKTEDASDTSQAAAFMTLMKLAFRGNVRYSKSGDFNAGFGYYLPGVTVPSTAEFRDVSRLIHRCEFRNEDFQTVMREARRGDLIYMDPPYMPIKPASFTAYTKAGFTAEDHDQVLVSFEDAASLGATVVMSNAPAQPIIDWADKAMYSVYYVKAGRRLHVGGAARFENEVLVVAP